jgi:Zn-dependent membrane protease YugP
MKFDLTTPALLFPAVTLLMLAYTNRFNTLAAIIRNLHEKYQKQRDRNLHAQISNLRYRVYLIRNMQICGVLSLLLCMVSMFALFEGLVIIGQWLFGSALVLMIISMGISLRELQVSVGALDLLLMDMEEEKQRSD